MGERQTGVWGRGEGAQLQNFPFRSNAPPQKYWKFSAKDFLNISTVAEPKLSVFQLLLEVESLSLKKTNKISKNLEKSLIIFIKDLICFIKR